PALGENALDELEQLGHLGLEHVRGEVVREEVIVVTPVLTRVHGLLAVEGADVGAKGGVFDAILEMADGAHEEALARREERREVVEEAAHSLRPPLPELGDRAIDFEAEITDLERGAYLHDGLLVRDSRQGGRFQPGSGVTIFCQYGPRILT